MLYTNPELSYHLGDCISSIYPFFFFVYLFTMMYKKHIIFSSVWRPQFSSFSEKVATDLLLLVLFAHGGFLAVDEGAVFHCFLPRCFRSLKQRLRVSEHHQLDKCYSHNKPFSVCPCSLGSVQQGWPCQ